MSDTEYKIKVMQAYEDGEEIEFRQSGSAWGRASTPVWDWLGRDYRIKPKLRDIYVNEYEDGSLSAFNQRLAAQNQAELYESSIKRIAVHYREVIDE